jgi:hypothetical protein
MSVIVAQINIDDSSDKTITGVYTFDRANGGTLIVPAGSAFPGTPVAGELFWRTDLTALYRRNTANTAWDAISGSGSAQRRLQDFINAPAEGYTSGAYRTITMGAVAPSNITWWTDNTATEKIFEVNYTRNAAQCATTVEWKVYDTGGVTVLSTITDTITYSGIIETSRTRTIA